MGMLFCNDKRLISIYFGNKSDKIVLDSCCYRYKVLKLIKNKLKASSLTFLKQEHGTHGEYVTGDFCGIEVCRRVGDFLFTDVVGAAIGIVTGDCLPIVFYDFVNHVCAIVHAGWNGSFNSISIKAVNLMQQNFKSKLENIEVYFGPSAGVCCYEVNRDFYNKFKIFDKLLNLKQVFVEKKEKLFFNNSLLNYLQLLRVGILRENIYRDYNCCTICDIHYHSYRREGNFAGRQATVVILL